MKLLTIQRVKEKTGLRSKKPFIQLKALGFEYMGIFTDDSKEKHSCYRKHGEYFSFQCFDLKSDEIRLRDVTSKSWI